MVGFAAFCAVLTIGALVLTVSSFLAVMPRVLDTAGRPGEDVIATTAVPGTITADLAADESYSLWIVDNRLRSRVDEPITVTDPAGESVRLGISGASTMTMGGKQARLLYDFEAHRAGEYTIVVPEANNNSEVEIYLAYAQSSGQLVGGIFGIVGGVFGIIIFSAATLALGIGGGFWWHSRVRKRKQFAANPYSQGNPQAYSQGYSQQPQNPQPQQQQPPQGPHQPPAPW